VLSAGMQAVYSRTPCRADIIVALLCCVVPERSIYIPNKKLYHRHTHTPAHSSVRRIGSEFVR